MAKKSKMTQMISREGGKILRGAKKKSTVTQAVKLSALALASTLPDSKAQQLLNLVRSIQDKE